MPAAERSQHPYAELTPDRVLDALANRRPPRRRTAAGARQLRESRLPDRHRGRRRCRREVLPAGALVGCRDRAKSRTSSPSLPRARFRSSRRSRFAGPHAARVGHLSLRGLSEMRRSRPGARPQGNARMDGPLPRPHPRGRRAEAVLAPAGARRPHVRHRATRLAARPRFHSARPASKRGGAIATQALDGVQRCYDRAGDVRSLRLHGDCHAGNVLWIEHGDHARSAFRRFRRRAHGPGGAGPVDAALGRSRGHDAPARVTCSPDTTISSRSIRASSTSSRRCARCACSTTRRGSAQRWDDPAFPAAFPWFNTQRYWQDRILELREQVALMDEPQLGST